MTPRPPSLARAIAISCSVTVSIGELSSGMLSAIRLVSRVVTLQFGRHDIAIPRLQQHIVERDGIADEFVLHDGLPVGSACLAEP